MYLDSVCIAKSIINMRLDTGTQFRFTMAGYLFIGTGTVFLLGFVSRAIYGFMGQPEQSPFGYLALAWLMVIFIIVGRIILQMRGDVSDKDTYLSRHDPARRPRTSVPGNWTGRFVGWIFFGVGSTFAMLAASWLQGTPIYGRTLVLGVIFTILGAIILIVTYRALYISGGDAKIQTKQEAKPFAMLGLIVAALVLLVFSALGVLVLIKNPDNWGGAVFMFSFPVLGIIIFLFVRSRKMKARRIQE